jgi:hypothetical protein
VGCTGGRARCSLTINNMHVHIVSTQFVCHPDLGRPSGRYAARVFFLESGQSEMGKLRKKRLDLRRAKAFGQRERHTRGRYGLAPLQRVRVAQCDQRQLEGARLHFWPGGLGRHRGSSGRLAKIFSRRWESRRQRIGLAPIQWVTVAEGD